MDANYGLCMLEFNVISSLTADCYWMRDKDNIENVFSQTYVVYDFARLLVRVIVEGFRVRVT